MKEPITLRIQGVEYSYWDSADIVSEAYNICRAFTVGMTVKAPGMGAFFDTFKPGQACEVLIGGDLVCTGYIDQAPVKTLHEAARRGRASRLHQDPQPG